MRSPRTCRRCRSAFTLVETMVSVAIAAIILGAMMSAVVLAAQAVPQRGSGLDRAAQAAGALDRVLADIYFAKAVPQRDNQSITLTVADRNNDGADETIRYAWSGVAGAALTCQVNGGTAATLAQDVREFSLSYDLASATRTLTSTTESAETLLADCSGGLLDYAYGIESTKWPAQYVRPTLPAGTVSWRITRILWRGRYHGGTGGVTQVQVRGASASKQPLNYVVDHAAVRESALGLLWGWVEVPFAAAGPLDPTLGACLVWQWGSDTHSADVLYHSVGSALSGNYLLTTSNAGASWTANTLATACVYVYGTYTTNNTPTTVTDYYLQRARGTLRCGTDLSGRVHGSTTLLNAPQVTGP